MAKDKRLAQYRFFLKDTIRRQIDFAQTAQGRGLPPPPVQKPCPENAPRIALAAPDTFAEDYTLPLVAALSRRRSRRRFTPEPLSLTELAFLLWATQGVRETMGNVATMRTVPSAGARHAFETYLYVRDVTGLDEGLYRYLPLDHKLVVEGEETGLGPRISEACLGQTFAAQGALTFIWTAIPERMEWRYGLAAHKVIAIDAGHVCQNLYLACEAIGAGTCAIGAYHQEAMDALLGVDGNTEFTVYIAPVGKVHAGD